MKILFINNDGGGYADHIDVAEGSPLDDFFRIPFVNNRDIFLVLFGIIEVDVNRYFSPDLTVNSDL